MNDLTAIKDKPARKCAKQSDDGASPLELALRDTHAFLYGKKGHEELKDVEFAKRLDEKFVGRLYATTLEGEARRRKGKVGSEKNLKAVANKTWPMRTPSGKNYSYVRFYPRSSRKFRWGALSLIELPSTISRHRGMYGHLYLAVDYLDLYLGSHDPQSKVGQMDQWTLFTAHAFDRYAQRALGQDSVLRSDALHSYAEASLAAEGKALIQDKEGRVIYAIKTKEKCIYFMGYARLCEEGIFRFFKTVITESMLRNGQRKYLTRVNATFDTWTNEASSSSGWEKLPIVGDR